jgi:ElaB/YqjD/DUF883 family membrane-anchored ribosome-binding protein
MFNLNKDKVDDLATQSESLVNDASQAIKSKARDVSAAIDEKADKTKYEANNLISSLKDLINEYSDNSKINQLKGQISETATGLKTAVCNEVSNAYTTSKQKTSDAIKENPLGTLALVAGAGLVVGYIFGARQSDK